MTTNKPFFAQLLSAQELKPQDVSAVSGGATAPILTDYKSVIGGTTPPTSTDFRSKILNATPVTLRYPSDSDSLTTIDFPFKTE